MPEGVVNFFEVVQIHHQERQRQSLVGEALDLVENQTTGSMAVYALIGRTLIYAASEASKASRVPSVLIITFFDPNGS